MYISLFHRRSNRSSESRRDSLLFILTLLKHTAVWWSLQMQAEENWTRSQKMLRPEASPSDLSKMGCQFP